MNRPFQAMKNRTNKSLATSKHGVWLKRAKKETGFTLTEIIVGIALFSILGMAFLGALATAVKILNVTNEKQTALSLAESQMEYVKNESYQNSYAPGPVPSEYAGYTVTVDTASVGSRDSNIQKISITVSHGANPIILSADSTLESYKVNQ